MSEQDENQGFTEAPGQIEIVIPDEPKQAVSDGEIERRRKAYLETGEALREAKAAYDAALRAYQEVA